MSESPEKHCTQWLSLKLGNYSLPFLSSLSECCSFSHVQEIWNALKITKKGTVQWTGRTNTLPTRKYESYRCANCDPNSPALQKKNHTRPNNAWRSWPPDGEDGLKRKVRVCPSVAAWIPRRSTQSIKILILAISCPFLFTVICFSSGPASSKWGLVWIVCPRPALRSDRMDGTLAYQWWVSHSLVSGLDKCLSSALPWARVLCLL